MNAQRLIEEARAAGLSLEVDGADLVVDADRDPPPEMIAELRRCKADIIAFLVQRVPELPDRHDLDERAALIQRGAGVPRAWAEGFAALSTMPAPTGFLPNRWARIVDAVGVFIARWANAATACGWADIDIFGCNPDAPDRRFDAMGLGLLLDRVEVVGIDRDGADLLVTKTGVKQRYRRRAMPPDTVSLWQLVKAASSPILKGEK